MLPRRHLVNTAMFVAILFYFTAVGAWQATIFLRAMLSGSLLFWYGLSYHVPFCLVRAYLRITSLFVQNGDLRLVNSSDVNGRSLLWRSLHAVLFIIAVSIPLAKIIPDPGFHTDFGVEASLQEAFNHNFGRFFIASMVSLPLIFLLPVLWVLVDAGLRSIKYQQKEISNPGKEIM